MVPANVRLKRAHHLGLNIHNRLKAQKELLFAHRFAQIFAQTASKDRLVFQIGGIKAILPAPAILCCIKRQIR